MLKPAPSATRRPAPAPQTLGAIDAGLIALLLLFAVVLMARSGDERGVDLLPSPDGLEYAAVAVNLDRGLGPVLHFGGYSYPSRYTEGYPLILAAAFPIVGRRVARLWMVTAALGLIAVVGLYLLVFELFGRTAAFFATLVMAASPTFITYSTLVLSDVPTLTVTILAALALTRACATESRVRRIVWWAIFGLLGGFTVMIRPTNAAILIGVVVAAALLWADGRARSRWWLAALAVFVIGFVIAPLWQMRENALHLGGALKNGYAFWVPGVYGTWSHSFGARFLFGRTMPNNPYGNLPIYALVLSGLDGFLGAPGDPRYLLYPFAAAVFAIVGIVAALRDPPHPMARRVVGFGVGFLAALLLIYLGYFFTAETFLLPGCFVLFAGCGYGLVLANRALGARWGRARKSGGDQVTIAVVIVLDVLLAASMVNEVGHRLAVQGAGSETVPAIESVKRRIAPHAIVVSNISLQFLELYARAPGRKFVGLDSYDPGESFTDYHLHRLYARRAAGMGGPVPAVLFNHARQDAGESAALATAARGGRRLFLLLAAPESRAYQSYLRKEIGDLARDFELAAVATPGPVALYEMTPRASALSPPGPP